MPKSCTVQCMRLWRSAWAGMLFESLWGHMLNVVFKFQSVHLSGNNELPLKLMDIFVNKSHMYTHCKECLAVSAQTC